MPSPPPRRAWGTRFDSLVDQSSKSPTTNSDVNSRDTTFSNIDRDRDATPTATAEKERLGHNLDYDRAYPRSTPSGVGQSNDMSPSYARMPHDASVFVASLPSHVPDTELQANLSTQFSQHATIKHIKLIRDNRGAVCAFVQVETAAQAAKLIAACNLTQFMDRLIRCETARAFRTLLVSWRQPHNAGGNEQDQDQDHGGIQKALRLRRCRGSRYIHIAHGAEALSSDLAQLPNYSAPRADDVLCGEGVLFPQGIQDGDFESLKSLLEAFGTLEFITSFEPTAAQRPAQYSYEPQPCGENPFTRGSAVSSIPQGEANAKGEETTEATPKMWAAKWEHRNDAVSAITALQHVPNLFICWAHSYGRPIYVPYASGYTGSAHAHTHPSSGSYLPTSPSHPSTPYTPRYGRSDTAAVQPSDSRPDNMDVDVDPNTQWAVVHPPVGPRLQQLHAQALSLPAMLDNMKTAPEPVSFSDSDFPPLKAEGLVQYQGGRGRKRGAWVGRKNFVRAGAPSPPPISTNLSSGSLSYNGVETPTSVTPHTPDLDSVVEPSPITPAFPMTPRTPNGGYGPPSSNDGFRKDRVYMSVPTFPSQYGSFPARRGSEDAEFENGPENGSDGKELFVGGLDVATWDEERVKSVFGRFGTIEEVRFVKPGYHAPPHKRAFAFIKFADQEAPQRAIGEEHLRVYDDRKIKVQLRETYPRRGGYRGRGRFHHGHFRPDRVSLDFDRDGSAGEAPGSDTAEGGHMMDSADTGHVRFASAPDVVSAKLGAEEEQDAHADVPRAFQDAAGSSSPVNETVEERETQRTELEGTVVEQQETPHADMEPFTPSTPSCSDGAPDASMEAQPRSADTTITLADVADSTSHPAEELPSEPDALTNVSATPPPSNPEAASTYAPSSTGSAPTSTGYYPSAPSWMPPYTMPPTPYAPYGFYSQAVPGQPGTDASTAYPWMAAVYRNVMPFVPWFNPPPGVELATPPVRPTGYIQREPGGIFIPVYPPERLGQYMSTSGAAIDGSQTQTQAVPPSTGSWQNMPPHPQLYSMPLTAQQQTMMMQQQAAAQQQLPQVPMAGNGWITGPPPGTAYNAPHAPSSAPPPYPAPNTCFPPQNPTAPAHNVRQGMYGPYDGGMQHSQPKHAGRRGSEYMHQHRLSTNFGPREGRPSPQRRGPGGHGPNASEQSFAGGAVDSQFGYAQMKSNSALPAQLNVPPTSNGSEWNWNGQSR